MKRYLIQINESGKRYYFFTEDELYKQIYWTNDYLRWTFKPIRFTAFSRNLKENEFLKAYNDISLLVSQFEEVISIETFITK